LPSGLTYRGANLDNWRHRDRDVLPATSATELIRAASLTSFPEVARSCGLQPEALLLEAGIDRRALQDPEMRISAPAFGRLLELAAQQAKVEAFGLHMGETRSIAILGPVGLLLREEPTVRHAIGRWPGTYSCTTRPSCCNSTRSR